MYVTQFCTTDSAFLACALFRMDSLNRSDAELDRSRALVVPSSYFSPSICCPMSTRKLLVDVHTHVYLPRYASFLRARAVAPRIFSRPVPGGPDEDRLVILDNEPSGGRPVGPQVFLLQQERLLCLGMMC